MKKSTIVTTLEALETRMEQDWGFTGCGQADMEGPGGQRRLIAYGQYLALSELLTEIKANTLTANAHWVKTATTNEVAA